MKSQKKPEQQAQIAAIKARLNKAIDAAGFKMNPLLKPSIIQTSHLMLITTPSKNF